MGRAKPIMIQGTMSNAGKSLLAAGLCRVLSQDGLRVAPFKSQNMALNSGVTSDGLEMGRAQIMQAEACGIAPDVRMNPILLKPESDHRSQLIVAGKAQGAFAARDYFARKKALMPQILETFDSLAEENDVIVIEGAGSPSKSTLPKTTSSTWGSRAPCPPRAARGRHRPRRGVCPALRHGRAPCARGPRAFAGACGEQVPRRCGNPAPGFGPAREDVRGSRRGGRAVSYARPGRRGLARAAPICPRDARRHRRRRRAPSASVELHRLRPAFARARHGRALRFLDDRSGPTRPGGAPWLEDYARRRALACG